jgi:predicted aldo/keto reductase-like oxidoreductase
MRLYAKLDTDASACTYCPAPCVPKCPLGIPIREKMLDAHRTLTFKA